MSHVALVGAELEENLSLRYLAAAVQGAGFTCGIHPFDHKSALAEVVDAILESAPIVVGISVPFQTRAPELLAVAAELRARGYAGHVIVGGHFATFEYEGILRAHPAIDSVARHEGEDTFVEVCSRIAAGERVGPIAGLIVREARLLPIAGRAANGIAAGPKRPLPELDTLPLPDRRGTPHDVLGVPVAPIIGSRGCYADCSFCCIYAYADNADGARYRMRSPESIVAEMTEEHHRRGVRLFVFHDDNFFVPSRRKNLARYRRLKELLDDAGLTDIGLVIKCRPNDVDRELFELLKSMGMIRAYVGIETNSDEGVVSLNRRITPEDNVRALELLRELDVYCSFNVLIFDPEATLEGVERNLDFMERFADVPFNFCRAEVYAGTPLKSRLESQGRLRGDYLAWTYEMQGPRVELLFRISTVAFNGRNFKGDGVANLNMGLRMDAEVLRRFWRVGWDETLAESLRELSRDIGTDAVTRMREALAFVRACDPRDVRAVNAYTVELSRGVARADLAFLTRIKVIRREMEGRACAAGAADIRNRFGRGMPVWAAETARLGSSTGREIRRRCCPHRQPSEERNERQEHRRDDRDSGAHDVQRRRRRPGAAAASVQQRGGRRHAELLRDALGEHDQHHHQLALLRMDRAAHHQQRRGRWHPDGDCVGRDGQRGPEPFDRGRRRRRPRHGRLLHVVGYGHGWHDHLRGDADVHVHDLRRDGPARRARPRASTPSPRARDDRGRSVPCWPRRARRAGPRVQRARDRHPHVDRHGRQLRSRARRRAMDAADAAGPVCKSRSSWTGVTTASRSTPWSWKSSKI